MKKYYRYIFTKSILGLGIFLFIVYFLYFFTKKQNLNNQNNQFNFAIVPHFSIQPTTIQNFYRFLQTNYNIPKNKKIDIIIISPDHFQNLTGKYAKYCNPTICYKKICMPTLQKNYQTIPCISQTTIKEHGIGELLSFIKNNFPKANILPIIVSPRNMIYAQNLINIFQSEFQSTTKTPTLLLASVDFSHYVQEDFAKLHDATSFYVLNNSTESKDYNKLEVDCPSCLYIVNTLAQTKGKFPKLFLRDSSTNIYKKEMGVNNTSRQFIYYTDTKEEKNGFTIAFFGDFIFDRGVRKKLHSEKEIINHFKYFFQEESINKVDKKYIHKKLFGIDMVGFNLETPLVNNKSICTSGNKTIEFCSDTIILPYIKNMGFTIANIANNHSFDGGKEAFDQTINNLKNNKIIPIGYSKDGKHYSYKTTIRTIKIAWEGFDFTTTRGVFSRYCDILHANNLSGYISIVSVHRGTEYQTQPNKEQEKIAKKLIDCGANIIIGHHPHVIQKIGWYKNKPIIYSLGNFLFDMKSLPDTKTGGYVLIKYTNDGIIDLTTGKIHASVYK